MGRQILKTTLADPPMGRQILKTTLADPLIGHQISKTTLADPLIGHQISKTTLADPLIGLFDHFPTKTMQHLEMNERADKTHSVMFRRYRDFNSISRPYLYSRVAQNIYYIFGR